MDASTNTLRSTNAYLARIANLDDASFAQVIPNELSHIESAIFAIGETVSSSDFPQAALNFRSIVARCSNEANLAKRCEALVTRVIEFSARSLNEKGTGILEAPKRFIQLFEQNKNQLKKLSVEQVFEIYRAGLFFRQADTQLASFSELQTRLWKKVDNFLTADGYKFLEMQLRLSDYYSPTGKLDPGTLEMIAIQKRTIEEASQNETTLKHIDMVLTEIRNNELRSVCLTKLMKFFDIKKVEHDIEVSYPYAVYENTEWFIKILQVSDKHIPDGAQRLSGLIQRSLTVGTDEQQIELLERLKKEFPKYTTKGNNSEDALALDLTSRNYGELSPEVVNHLDGFKFSSIKLREGMEIKPIGFASKFFSTVISTIKR